MATLATNTLTICDWARRVDGNGQIAKIAEVLTERNDILLDIPFLEGNLETGHRSTLRSKLPDSYFRSINEGIPVSKSSTRQITDTCGNLEAYSECDKDLADLNGDRAAFLMSEASAHLAGMGQKAARYLFYGNAAIEPSAFTGLAPRYNSFANENADMILDGGSTNPNQNSSVWVVNWGPETCHGIFPKGSTAGLQFRDLGETTLTDNQNDGLYQGYRSHFKFKLGLVVRDWRYVARLCNIDTTLLDNAGTAQYAGPALIEALITLTNRIPNPNFGRQVIYCNRTVYNALDLLVTNKANLALSWQEFAGQKVLMFRGTPVRRCDAILDTEERVV